MLTETDIHYVAGLLIANFESDENIDLELGSWLYDTASESERDIDITLTYKQSDGSLGAFKAWEVKNHTRRMTTDQVEQLCIKFNDIPSITHRGIISASGYSKPAIKKAAKHGVDLYHLEPWTPDDSSENFGAKFDRKFLVDELMFHWHKTFPTHVLIDNGRELPTQFSPDTQLYESTGNISKFSSLQKLFEQLDQRTIDEFISDRGSFDPDKDKLITTVNVLSKVGPLFLVQEGEKFRITHIRSLGEIIRIRKVHKPEFKVLRKHDAKKPFIGCAIAETKLGLIGLTIDRKTGLPEIGIFQVPISDRLKKKIYREKFLRI